jgi:hypothetical protein
MSELLISDDILKSCILYIRGQKVILDVDLALLYGVPTKRLNEQVKRNRERFPNDFMFKLTECEKDEVVANCDHLRNLKFSKTLPCAFTEHGVIMAASVLNSKRAVDVSVFIVRAFVKLRQILLNDKELGMKFTQLENRVKAHDKVIKSVVIALNELMTNREDETKRQIGFATDAENAK